jgi:hypothetical protein
MCHAIQTREIIQGGHRVGGPPRLRKRLSPTKTIRHVFTAHHRFTHQVHAEHVTRLPLPGFYPPAP